MNRPERFLRIVRLDDSDQNTYEPAAAAGEWAVVGSFHFWDSDLEQLAGKQRQAFVHGFLGTDSFGWATLAAVTPIAAADYDAVIARLAGHLVERFGAPDTATALPAAREEAEFVAGLCREHEVHTLLAIQRSFDGECIEETFKVIRPPSAADHETLRLWEWIDDPPR
ncbi:MAG: DUF6505 family protein [Candidatus Competibacterales bacterium]|nr:DUF6505 family protein [Candidatus Competibacterales bacterium]